MREMSDGLLMAQLAGYLVFEAAYGDVCFADWADGQKFTPSERAYVETCYLAVEVIPRMVSV